MSDEGEGAQRKWTDVKIGEAFNLHVNSVWRIRKKFLEQVEAPAIERKLRRKPPVDPKVDGELEAQIVALCCSEPPEERAKTRIAAGDG